MEIIEPNQKPISTADWFVTILIASIPILGFIMLFVWAFGDGSKPSKSNWAKATLLWYFAGLLLGAIVISIVGLASLTSLVDQ